MLLLTMIVGQTDETLSVPCFRNHSVGYLTSNAFHLSRNAGPLRFVPSCIPPRKHVHQIVQIARQQGPWYRYIASDRLLLSLLLLSVIFMLMLVISKRVLTVAAASIAASIIVLLVWAEKARSYRRMDGDRLEGWHRSGGGGGGRLGGSSNSILLDIIKVIRNKNTTFEHVCTLLVMYSTTAKQNRSVMGLLPSIS
jgi:hypothetical protein